MKAVFLDVDDTLVDYQRAARAAFAAALGTDDGYDRFQGLDHYTRYLDGEFDFETFRNTRMADFLVLLGRDDDARRAADLERQRFESLEHHYVLYDDVAPCLAMLRERGLPIGLITNNESVHQRAKLAAVGLDKLVDAIVISDEVGVAKPDERIFVLACARLDVAPDQAVHVGDNINADAHGARAAGLGAVWLDRLGVHDGGELPFPVIPGLDGLRDLQS